MLDFWVEPAGAGTYTFSKGMTPLVVNELVVRSTQFIEGEDR
jgi:hypothetical protein